MLLLREAVFERFIRRKHKYRVFSSQRAVKRCSMTTVRSGEVLASFSDVDYCKL